MLKLPGERLRSELRETEGADRHHGVRAARAPATCCCGMIRTLHEDIDALQPASALAVANGVLNILVAGLQTLPAARSPALSNLTAFHLARIKRRIDEQLDDPALSVGTLAAALGLSVSQIHRVFKSEPLTPAQYIWERRLEACSRDLLDPRVAGRTVGEIAYGRGFSDAAHFSRAFRERFGCSPRSGGCGTSLVGEPAATAPAAPRCRSAMTLVATEPLSARPKMPWPCVPITTSSTWASVAAFRISSAAWPWRPWLRKFVMPCFSKKALTGSRTFAFSSV